MNNQNEDRWQCVQCNRKYTNYSSYYVHMKNKHKQQNIARDITTVYKMKFSEQQLNDLEDKIYVFLGQLGDNNPQVAELSQQLEIGQSNNNKLNGQSNYLTNFIVRTPYETEIDVKQQVPKLIVKQEWEKYVEKFKQQILALNDLLLVQKDKWEFMDPLDPDINIQDEFSLMDIPKLVKNIQKKKLKFEYPQFIVYVIWLSRICKGQIWKQIYEIVAYCVCQYHDFLKSSSFNKTVMSWISFINQRDENSIKQYNLKLKTVSISDANWNRFLNFYYKWVQYFNILPKKQLSNV